MSDSHSEFFVKNHVTIIKDTTWTGADLLPPRVVPPPAYGHQWSAYGPRTVRLSWWRRLLAKILEVG